MNIEVNDFKNVANVIGEICEPCTFSHEVYGESFYSFKIKVDRLSSENDILPVIMSDRLFEKEDLLVGKKVSIEGQIRSYNKFIETENKNKLVLYIFTNEISILEDFEKDKQEIIIDGFICKKPIYRTTPFGREICDVLLAVNRAYNKSDYIPCISWGRNAKFTSKLQLGDNIKITGRLQSRFYQKKLENAETLNKVAYEVSISKIVKK